MTTGSKLKTGKTKILVNNNMEDGRRWWASKHYRILILLCWRIDIFIRCFCCSVPKSSPTLFDCMDCSPSGFSVHGVFQARTLEWVAISFSRRSSWPRDWTWVSHTVGRRFTVWATRKYKKDLNDPNNQDGVITYLEPNILECEVKEALGNGTMNKASGGDGIPVE